MTESDIIAFFGTPTARFIGVPILTLTVSIFLKLFSKSKIVLDDRNLFYLGNNLSTTAILLLFVEFCNAATDKNTDQLIKVFLVFIFVAFVSFCMTQFIRSCGWEERKVIGGFQLTLWCGIIIPDIVGAGLLFISLIVLY